MTNRTYLISCDEPVRYVDLTWPIVVCASDYAIPPLWLMLFGKDNVAEASTSFDDGSDLLYSRLESDKSSAIARAKAQESVLAQLNWPEAKQTFGTWISHIERVPGSRVVVETCELAMMSADMVEFAQALLRGVTAFSTHEKRGLEERLGALGLMDFTNREVSGLCGYAWENPVPWSDT